jgi:cytoskeleton protein RodZ
MLQPSSNEAGNTTGPAGERAAAQARVATPAVDASWRAGRKLSEARKQLGWSLDHVAERIRVRREFLEALEDMNVKLLPGKAYALAFLRSYARELGLDERALVDQFQDECALSREDAKKQIRNPRSKPGRERPWLAAVALMALASAFVAWRAIDTGGQQDAVVEGPEVTAPGAAPIVASAQRVVEVRAATDGWLEARGPDGTVFLSQDLRAGEVYRPDPSPGWTLHARDGAAFEVFVDGVSAGPLGQAGMPVLGRSIDEIEPIVAAAPPPA